MVALRRVMWMGCVIVTLAGVGCGGTAEKSDQAAKDNAPPDAADAADDSANDTADAKDTTDDAASAAPHATGTEAEARALLQEFLVPGADYAALSKQLRPTSEDYRAVFEESFAKQAESTYSPAWDQGVLVLEPNPGQTELRLYSATTNDLQKWNEQAEPFPGGYKEVADKFLPGLTIYRFKFVEPGESLGMAFDGLIFVNGQWRIFPKPWRIR